MSGLSEVVISITDHKVCSFSDESLGHKIFYPGRISALLQLDEIGVSYSSVGVNTKIQTGPIRMLCITDLEFVPFTDIIIETE